MKAKGIIPWIVAGVALILIGVGTGMVYTPAGLISVGMLLWVDLALRSHGK